MGFSHRQSSVIAYSVILPNQPQCQGFKDTSSGDLTKYLARDVREKYKEGSGGQGEGQKLVREKVLRRYKGTRCM